MLKLPTFRGESRFTTWAYKFAPLETGVRVRRRARHAREIPLESDGWARLPDRRASPAGEAETAELLGALRDAIADALLNRARLGLLFYTVYLCKREVNVAPRLEHPRSLRRPRTMAAGTRPRRPSLPAPGHPSRPYRPPEPAGPIDEPTPLPDRGLELVVAFVAAVLVMVAMAVVVGMVDAAWILIPVMVVDFAVTAGVLIMVARLLNDGDGR